MRSGSRSSSASRRGGVPGGPYLHTRRQSAVEREEGDGNRYFGGVDGQGRMHGAGRMQYADGSVFEGTWHEGHKQGPGRFTYADQSFVAGSWTRDKMDGPFQRTLLKHCRNGASSWTEMHLIHEQWHHGKRDLYT